MKATDIYVREGGERYLIGSVIPPTANNKPIYTTDSSFQGKRSPDGKPVYVGDALEDLWSEWRKEVEHPDTDSDFVLWLMEEHGWTVTDAHHEYTFGG